MPSVTEGCEFGGSGGASIDESSGDMGPSIDGRSNLTKIAVSIWSSSNECEGKTFVSRKGLLTSLLAVPIQTGSGVLSLRRVNVEFHLHHD